MRPTQPSSASSAPATRQVPRLAGGDLRPGGGDPLVGQFARIGEGHARQGLRHLPVVDQAVQRRRVLRSAAPAGRGVPCGAARNREERGEHAPGAQDGCRAGAVNDRLPETQERPGHLRCPGRSVLRPTLAGRARAGSLRRGLEARRSLAPRALLRELLLERAQRLVGGAAHGADQRGAVPHQRVRVLAHEALLQLDDRRRVGEAEQLLRDPQVGLHHALDQADHALLDVPQAALGGVRQREEPAHVLGRALGRLGDLAAHLLEALRRVLHDLALALGHRLPAPARRLARGLAGAAQRLGPGLAVPARDVGARVGALAQRLAGGAADLLGGFGGAADRSVGVATGARCPARPSASAGLVVGCLASCGLLISAIPMDPQFQSNLRRKQDCCGAQG